MKCFLFFSSFLNILYFQEFSVINDENFHRVIQTIPPELRNKSEISSALYQIRDELNKKLRGCDDDATVKIYMDEFLLAPITLTSGAGRNIIDISIDSDGQVNYRWERKKWETHCKNAGNKVRAITKTMVSKLASALPRRRTKLAIKSS